MRFKLGCASVVIASLCFWSTWGGALKNAFTKNEVVIEDQNESKEGKPNDEKPKVDDTKVTEKATVSSTAESKQEPAPKSEKKEIVGNPVIYRIGNKEIRRDEILAEMKLLPPQLITQTPADKLFDIMKRQKLMTYLILDQAKKAGMDKEKAYIDQVNKLKERILFENYLVRELEPKASNNTTLQQHYQKYLVEFKSGKEIKISTIALGSEKEAKEVIDALNKGAPFDKLQKEKGLASSENSERYVSVLRMPEELKKKFKKIEKNEFTQEPIKLAEVYHIIKIMDMRDSKPGKFEEVKPLLSQIILRKEMEKLLNKLESLYKVQKFNEDGTPEKPLVAPAA